MTFDAVGVDQFTVPAGVEAIGFDVRAGSGNVGAHGVAPGGNGARVTGLLSVTSGEVLQVYVGGQGGIGGAAGFNGGGAWSGGSGNANGGGGASDIRQGGNTLNDRVVVAGGGGGGGTGPGSLFLHSFGGNGGYPEGDPPTNSLIGTSGGTQTAGGSGNTSGSFGQGANASSGGAGGGGWYGGGSGGGPFGHLPAIIIGGGGGSSYHHPTATSGVTHTNGFQTGIGQIILTIPEAQLDSTPGNGGTLDFGAVRVGHPSSQIVSVQHTGDAGVLLIGSYTDPVGDASFTFIGNPGFSLAQSASANENYRFAPTARGAVAATSATIDAANAAGHAINLDGIGVGPVFDGDAAPSSTIDLGIVGFGQTASTVLTLDNLSDDPTLWGALTVGDLADLTVRFDGLTGLDAALFQITGLTINTPTAIDPGGSLNLTIDFLGAPSLSVRSATLAILTDQNAALADFLGGDGFSWTLEATVIPEPTVAAVFGCFSILLMNRRLRF